MAMTLRASSTAVFTLNSNRFLLRIKWRTGAAVEIRRAAAYVSNGVVMTMHPFSCARAK